MDAKTGDYVLYCYCFPQSKTYGRATIPIDGSAS